MTLTTIFLKFSVEDVVMHSKVEEKNDFLVTCCMNYMHLNKARG